LARPALSAARSVDIIDFLSSFPGRGFTLSELARAAKINIASCHAVLTALTERGYLTRNPKQRTYQLGPALVAIGHSALKSQPLIARTQAAAEALNREFDVPVLMSAVVGDDIVGIIAIPDTAGRWAGLRVGERVPLVPPVGAPFLAWASEAAIEAWIGRSPSRGDAEIVENWRRALAWIRDHGFQVTMRSVKSFNLSAMMAEMAAGRGVSEYKDQMVGLIQSAHWNLTQPHAIEPDELYDITLIAAPIFDANGEATFNLCFGNFGTKLKGSAILDYADRLVRTCLVIMRDELGAI
jgi:DNA-binding IclR family transcriptional regulator